MKRPFLLGSVLMLVPPLVGWLLLAPSVRAEAGLQLNPLKYEDTLTVGRAKAGFIDVANPSDTTVTIRTDVQSFRQIDLDGNLAFTPDQQLRAGIKPGLDTFELGPRESVRVAFTVDPSKLPQGGIYAAIFFRTTPVLPTQSQVSYIAESANVGTLLILRNGEAGQQVGQVSGLSLPLWQFGSGLRGQLRYRNTNRDTGGLAFRPQLTSRVTMWGQTKAFTGPFVMPQSTRQFDFERRGSYFGLLSVTVADGSSGHGLTRWVIACTGWYQVALLIVILLLLGWWLGRHHWPRLLRRRPTTVRHSLDGLGPRSDRPK